MGNCYLYTRTPHVLSLSHRHTHTHTNTHNTRSSLSLSLSLRETHTHNTRSLSHYKNINPSFLDSKCNSRESERESERVRCVCYINFSSLHMAEHTDRGLFHHHKKPEDEVVVESTSIHSTALLVDGKPVDSKTEIKKHAHKEHIAEAGALLSGAAAMYEKHQAKKDPENAHKHHIGEAVAGAVAIGSGAFALHERHDKKDAEKEGKHHH